MQAGCFGTAVVKTNLRSAWKSISVLVDAILKSRTTDGKTLFSGTKEGITG